MLTELKVSHFAIIDNLHVEFGPGLNILSGETGAGKSVLLKSLALLMGAKATQDMVRNGHAQAVIEGHFDLSERPDLCAKIKDLDIEIDGTSLLVRRIFGSEDKSKVYLNGSLCTLNILRELVAPLVEVAGQNMIPPTAAAVPLIEMTGQHENKNLLSRSYHLELLDQYAGTFSDRLLYEKKYSDLKSIQLEIQALEKQDPHRLQRLDFLKFQRDEIAGLELQPGEEVDLEQNVRRMKGLAKISDFVQTCTENLESEDDSVLTRIDTLIQRSQDLKNLDPQCYALCEPLVQARANIEAVVFDLRSYVNKMDADSESLEDLEQSLSRFRKIQKKYGQTLPEILQNLVGIENEIHGLENYEETLKKSRHAAELLRKDLQRLGETLHEKRSKAVPNIAKMVNLELTDLNMKGVQFMVRLEKELDPGPHGMDLVEFMSQTSAKDLPKPLAKFASGGELSRILLSLKKVVGAGGSPRTYLFDEVDSGVSGPTAEKVGRKLKSIAKGQQVICVTHLPQVAVFADHHFYIQKMTKNDQSMMTLKELMQKDRVQEIARLISGEKLSSSSIKHAEQLLREV